MFNLLVVLAAVLGPSPARPQPSALHIAYESALYSTGPGEGDFIDNYGERTFEFWRNDYGFGYTPTPTEARNCLSPALHFCIQLAELRFAIPNGELKPGATWWVDRFYRFRLLSIRTTRFRGHDIKTYLVKADDVFDKDWKPLVSNIFSYNYDIGIVGYSNAYDEDYRTKINGAPSNQGYIYVLKSEHGLGGAENCKVWRCGSAH